MNRIIRDHYPVSKLPEDLREGLDGQADVRVTIDLGPSPGAAAAASEAMRPLSYFKQFQRANYATMQEIDDHIEALRDEWSHRDR